MSSFHYKKKLIAYEKPVTHKYYHLNHWFAHWGYYKTQYYDKFEFFRCKIIFVAQAVLEIFHLEVTGNDIKMTSKREAFYAWLFTIRSIAKNQTACPIFINSWEWNVSALLSFPLHLNQNIFETVWTRKIIFLWKVFKYCICLCSAINPMSESVV